MLTDCTILFACKQANNSLVGIFKCTDMCMCTVTIVIFNAVLLTDIPECDCTTVIVSDSVDCIVESAGDETTNVLSVSYM